ncbi:MAG: hypothetical protein ACOC1O_01370 [bacterium]
MFKKIKSIKNVGVQKVYDLSVRNNSNFIAEGTVLHNCDYTGDLKVLLINLSEHDYEVHVGDRIAQLVIAPYAKFSNDMIVEVNSLTETKRGNGGFGSSGK